MLYSELFDEKGFFDELNTLYPDYYTSILSVDDVESLDMLMSMRYGGRIVISKITDIEKAVNAWYVMNRDTMVSIKKSIDDMIDLAIGNVEKRVKSGEIVNSGTDETQNQMNAYDNAEASNTDNNTRTSEGNRTEEVEETITRYNDDVYGTITERIKALRENFIDMVTKSVVDLLTISVL